MELIAQWRKRVSELQSYYISYQGKWRVLDARRWDTWLRCRKLGRFSEETFKQKMGKYTNGESRRKCWTWRDQCVQRPRGGRQQGVFKDLEGERRRQRVNGGEITAVRFQRASLNLRKEFGLSFQCGGSLWKTLNRSDLCFRTIFLAAEWRGDWRGQELRWRKRGERVRGLLKSRWGENSSLDNDRNSGIRENWWVQEML